MRKRTRLAADWQKIPVALRMPRQGFERECMVTPVDIQGERDEQHDEAEKGIRRCEADPA